MHAFGKRMLVIGVITFLDMHSYLELGRIEGWCLFYINYFNRSVCVVSIWMYWNKAKSMPKNIAPYILCGSKIHVVCLGSSLICLEHIMHIEVV